MSSDWREVTLEEVTTLLGDGLHGTPNYDYSGDYYFINGRNLSEGKIILDEKTKRANEEEYLKHKKDLNDRTILVSINGTLGNIAFYNNEDVFLGKSACYFNVNDEVEKEFIYYVLKDDFFQNHIDREATGTTIKNVSLKTMREFSFKLPPLETQEEIVSILGSLDQKIHLNQQTNETLETIAQAIFRSWFVDFDPVRAKIKAASAGRDPNRTAMAAIAGVASFAKASEDWDWDEIEAALDQKLIRMTEEQREQLSNTADLFPDELVESEIGEVPKGWGVKPFYDTIEIIGGGTPKTKIGEYWGGEILWYSVVDAPSGSDVFVIDTEKKITETGLENSSAKLVDIGTTIISARGTVGKLALTPKPMTYNQSCYGLRSKNDCPYFNFYKTNQLVESLKRGSHGSVFDTITQKTFKTIDIVQPPENLEKRFDDAVGGMMSEIQKNLEENSTLIQLRDTLLPKLISGEVGV